MGKSFHEEKIPSIPENEGLVEPMIKLRTDICPYCKAQKVELISFNGYPQGYKEAVNLYLKGYNVFFDQYEIRSMRCRSCNRELIIDWSDGFPKPLIDTCKTSMFFSEFIMGI